MSELVITSNNMCLYLLSGTSLLESDTKTSFSEALSVSVNMWQIFS